MSGLEAADADHRGLCSPTTTRQVTREEGAALAASWGMTTFTESSARHNENVSRIFEAVVAQIEKDMNPEPEAPAKGGCVVA